MKDRLLPLYHTIANLKNNPRSVVWLILVDMALAISSFVVDWPWLIRVPRHLILLAPICTLYPALLVVWLVLHLFHQKKPAWFTAFLFMGLVSYGVMAWIYFPAYMSWSGINLHDLGSIFWVSGYAFQALLLVSELQKLPTYQYVLIFGYFLMKDYSDRFLGTFLDVLLPSYPEGLKLFLTIMMVLIHIGAAVLVLVLPRYRQNASEVSTVPLSSTR